MDKQSEKLIELITEYHEAWKHGEGDWKAGLADCIIADGWIRPPCKVGDTVYVINSLWVSEYKINEISYDDIFMRFYCSNEEYAIECRTFMFFDERIGKTVFLSREDAEKALKNGGQLICSDL